MSEESKPVTLEELKREVIEGRNLVIKTDNLLKTLHAELKQVGKHQEEFERRQWRSSAVAYGIFAALAGVGRCCGRTRGWRERRGSGGGWSSRCRTCARRWSC